MDSLNRFAEALTPLLVGILGAAASLLGVSISNKNQSVRVLREQRFKAISKLYAHLNESERNLLRIQLSIDMKSDLDQPLQASIGSVEKISSEYDKSAIFLPESISKSIESMLSIAAGINAKIIMNKTKIKSEGIEKDLARFKETKKVLRECFQQMTGIKR